MLLAIVYVPLSTEVTISVKSLLFLHDWEQEVLMQQNVK